MAIQVQNIPDVIKINKFSKIKFQLLYYFSLNYYIILHYEFTSAITECLLYPS